MGTTKCNHTGKEPSPKGIGRCAHLEKLGSVAKGRDGTKWKITATKNGTKRWTKDTAVDCSKFVVYEKRKGQILHSIVGISADESTHIYKFIDYNKLDSVPFKIPVGYHKATYSKSRREHYCGNKLPISAAPRQSLLGYKSYFTHNNGARPYLVYVKGGDVKIYQIDSDKYYIGRDKLQKWMYSKLVKEYRASRVFIGKSPKNEMTTFSGGYGKAFDGNSILAQIGGREYVFIGERIVRFKSLAPIIKFLSPVGNNDVPYPFAIDGDGNYYLITENVIIRNLDGNASDPYRYYYKANLITADKGRVPPDEPMGNFRDIVEFYIGKNQYTLRYVPLPEKDYERLKLWDDFGTGPAIRITNGTLIKLNKAAYSKLMKDYGKKMGFKTLITKTIH